MWKSNWICLWILPSGCLIKFTWKSVLLHWQFLLSSRQYWYFMRMANPETFAELCQRISSSSMKHKSFQLGCQKRWMKRSIKWQQEKKRKENVTLELRTLNKSLFVFLPQYSFTCGFLFHKREDKHIINQRQKWKVTLSSSISLGSCFQHCLFWHC